VETLRRTRIGVVAGLMLIAGIAVAASPASAAKYRGKMVEAPPAGAQSNEPLSFAYNDLKGEDGLSARTISEGTVISAGKAKRKRPRRAKRVKNFRIQRLAGTECVISNDVSFPFETLTAAGAGWGGGYSAKVRPNGRFRLSYSIPVVLLSTIDVGAINDPPVNTYKVRFGGRVGLKSNSQPEGTASGSLRVSLLDAEGNAVCDSYGKRRWEAKRVRGKGPLLGR